MDSFIEKKKLFSCFSGLIGLFFFLLGRQIRKSIKTVTGKLVLKVIYIYAWPS